MVRLVFSVFDEYGLSYKNSKVSTIRNKNTITFLGWLKLMKTEREREREIARNRVH